LLSPSDSHPDKDVHPEVRRCTRPHPAFLITGDFQQFIIQIVGVLAAGFYASIMTVLILLVLKVSMGLRVKTEEEIVGLDQSAHSESGYNL
jgi:ammonium transporter, Amt family